MSASSVSFGDWIGLGGLVLALAAGVVGGWQLFEARQRRRVEMYWKLFDTFSSNEIRRSRSAFEQIEQRFELPRFSQPLSKERRKELAGRYWKIFYQGEGGDKTCDHRARERLRFYVQAGVLTQAKLVDRDLLFGLIGPSLDLDYKILDIIITACREHHEFHEMFKEVYYLNEQYKRWRRARDSDA